MLQLEMDDLERDIERIEKKVHLYECAKQQQAVEEYLEEHEFLKQKIEVSRKNEAQLEPERKRIGGYLKWHYTNRQEQADVSLEKQEEKCNKKVQQITEQKLRERECQQNLENLLVKISAYKTRVEGFEQEENKFNRNYQENFSRNILGDYEPGMLEIRKQEYEKQFSKLAREHKNHGLKQIELQEKKKTLERNREDKSDEKRNCESELQMLQRQGEEYENQLKERQKIMRYLEIEEDLLWQKERILDSIDHKLSQIDLSRGKLEQEERDLQKEWKKLTSGEVLELPADFQEMLQELELHPVYGMNWLEKNGYDLEENQRLVRTQPFLPYSLILPGTEIQKLKKYGREIYTSYPIPLIARETLEDVLQKEESSVLHLSGISFYLWFNEKLLDEAALRVLIREKEELIQKKQEQIFNRKQEYQNYSNKRSILENHTVTKEKLDKNYLEQEEMQEKVHLLEQEMEELKKERLALEKEAELLGQKLQEEKQTLDYCRRRETDFEAFISEYEAYQKNRKKIEEGNREKGKQEETSAQNAWALPCRDFN